MKAYLTIYAYETPKTYNELLKVYPPNLDGKQDWEEGGYYWIDCDTGDLWYFRDNMTLPKDIINQKLASGFKVTFSFNYEYSIHIQNDKVWSTMHFKKPEIEYPGSIYDKQD